MSEREIAGFLATVPLLEGRDEADLDRAGAGDAPAHGAGGRGALAAGRRGARGALRRRGRRVGDAPGARRAHGGDRGASGPGQILGEIALLDGRGHTMSVRATEATTVLALGRLDFAALLGGRHPAAFALKRRLAALFAARLRDQLTHLAGTLGGEAGRRSARARARRPRAVPAARQPVPAAHGDVPRLRSAGAVGLPDLGHATSAARRGGRCVAEGTPSPAYFLTVNGAVEKVLVRGDRRIRVGLAGPGKAFGYESLIDGLPSPIAAVTRERSVLLVLAARPLRPALPQGGRGRPRLPRGDPARPPRLAAPDAAPRARGWPRACDGVTSGRSHLARGWPGVAGGGSVGG